MKQALIRLAVLAILFVNQALVMFGWSPIPFSEEEVFAGVSAVATALASIWVWYKNNNLTKEAEEAQRILDAKKAKKKRINKDGK